MLWQNFSSKNSLGKFTVAFRSLDWFQELGFGFQSVIIDETAEILGRVGFQTGDWDFFAKLFNKCLIEIIVFWIQLLVFVNNTQRGSSLMLIISVRHQVQAIKFEKWLTVQSRLTFCSSLIWVELQVLTCDCLQTVIAMRTESVCWLVATLNARQYSFVDLGFAAVWVNIQSAWKVFLSKS